MDKDEERKKTLERIRKLSYFENPNKFSNEGRDSHLYIPPRREPSRKSKKLRRNTKSNEALRRSERIAQRKAMKEALSKTKLQEPQKTTRNARRKYKRKAPSNTKRRTKGKNSKKDGNKEVLGGSANIIRIKISNLFSDEKEGKSDGNDLNDDYKGNDDESNHEKGSEEVNICESGFDYRIRIEITDEMLRQSHLQKNLAHEDKDNQSSNTP